MEKMWDGTDSTLRVQPQVDGSLFRYNDGFYSHHIRLKVLGLLDLTQKRKVQG